jgi:hypothetical protein
MFFLRRMICGAEIEVLGEATWRQLAEFHRARAERHTTPARMRRDRGFPHPVADFLFEYYPYPFSLLENWHPGVGVALGTDSPTLPGCFSERHYTLADGRILADPRKISGKEIQRVEWTIALLGATHHRAPNFACHGLHEWAMVYRGKEVRHEKTLKLRLPQAEIDALVEDRAICCSHHDAFRFFAEEARPLNRMQPDLASRTLLEQPGCLHANMDLYKWAAKSMPWAGSRLLLDCFELAVQLRELDMRASPYDLTEWSLEPVRIETSEGRRIYEDEQKRLAAMARPLRDRLITALQRTLDAV